MKKILFFLLLGLVTRREVDAQASLDSTYTVDISLSPLDSLKPVRERTVAIILHTMEGTFRYGLKYMIDSALCNYAIGYDATIHNIVDKNKMSNGAGKSMLNRDTSISDITINIEFEGFSAIHPTRDQLSPRVAKFIYDLQVEFGIPDSMVIIHPVIACFYPYMKYTPYPGYYARGRKSDAFFFATTPIREKLGLGPMMKYDVDVWEGRMIQNKAQAKKMGMYIFSDEEIAERVAYLEKVERRRLDSIEASQVQPITMCGTDCLPIQETIFVLSAPLLRDSDDVENFSEEKQFFSLSPFILPRRLKVQK